MTATHIDPRTALPYLVGDRVRVQHQGRMAPGRISSVHHQQQGIEYVVRTEALDGGAGHVVNVWTTSGRSAYLAAADEGGASR